MSEKTTVKPLTWGPSESPEKKEVIVKKEKKPKEEPNDKVRATFYLHESVLTKLARAKYWDREDSQADIIEKALNAYWTGKTYEPTPKETVHHKK
jgi:hypothetical protein